MMEEMDVMSSDYLLQITKNNANTKLLRQSGRDVLHPPSPHDVPPTLHPPPPRDVPPTLHPPSTPNTSGNPLLYDLHKQSPLYNIQDPLNLIDKERLYSPMGELFQFCSNKEMIEKQKASTANDLERLNLFFEGDPDARWVNSCLALKSFQRSDASKQFKPEETRRLVTCRKAVHMILSYFVDADIVKKPYLYKREGEEGGYTYLDIHNFLRDRLRAIWQDITIQHGGKHRAYIETLEISCRFLILGEGLLGHRSREEFDPVQNSSLLTTCLDKLMSGYEDVRHFMNRSDVHQIRMKDPSLFDVLVYRSPYESEFWTYRILLNATSESGSGFIDTMCNIPKEFRLDDDVLLAMEVHKSFHNTNIVRYFKLMEKATYLQGVLIHKYSNLMRIRYMQMFVASFIKHQHTTHLKIDVFKRQFGCKFEEDFVWKSLIQYFGIRMETEVLLNLKEMKIFSYTNITSLKQIKLSPFKSKVLEDKWRSMNITRQQLLDPSYHITTNIITSSSSVVTNQMEVSNKVVETFIAPPLIDGMQSKGENLMQPPPIIQLTIPTVPPTIQQHTTPPVAATTSPFISEYSTTPTPHLPVIFKPNVTLPPPTKLHPFTPSSTIHNVGTATTFNTFGILNSTPLKVSDVHNTTIPPLLSNDSKLIEQPLVYMEDIGDTPTVEETPLIKPKNIRSNLKVKYKKKMKKQQIIENNEIEDEVVEATELGGLIGLSTWTQNDHHLDMLSSVTQEEELPAKLSTVGSEVPPLDTADITSPPELEKFITTPPPPPPIAIERCIVDIRRLVASFVHQLLITSLPQHLPLPTDGEDISIYCKFLFLSGCKTISCDTQHSIPQQLYECFLYCTMGLHSEQYIDSNEQLIDVTSYSSSSFTEEGCNELPTLRNGRVHIWPPSTVTIPQPNSIELLSEGYVEMKDVSLPVQCCVHALGVESINWGVNEVYREIGGVSKECTSNFTASDTLGNAETVLYALPFVVYASSTYFMESIEVTIDGDNTHEYVDTRDNKRSTEMIWMNELKYLLHIINQIKCNTESYKSVVPPIVIVYSLGVASHLEMLIADAAYSYTTKINVETTNEFMNNLHVYTEWMNECVKQKLLEAADVLQLPCNDRLPLYNMCCQCISFSSINHLLMQSKSMISDVLVTSYPYGVASLFTTRLSASLSKHETPFQIRETPIQLDDIYKCMSCIWKGAVEEMKDKRFPSYDALMGCLISGIDVLLCRIRGSSSNQWLLPPKEWCVINVNHMMRSSYVFDNYILNKEYAIDTFEALRCIVESTQLLKPPVYTTGMTAREVFDVMHLSFHKWLNELKLSEEVCNRLKRLLLPYTIWRTTNLSALQPWNGMQYPPQILKNVWRMSTYNVYNRRGGSVLRRWRKHPSYSVAAINRGGSSDDTSNKLIRGDNEVLKDGSGNGVHTFDKISSIVLKRRGRKKGRWIEKERSILKGVYDEGVTPMDRVSSVLELSSDGMTYNGDEYNECLNDRITNLSDRLLVYSNEGDRENRRFAILRRRLTASVNAL